MVGAGPCLEAHGVPRCQRTPTGRTCGGFAMYVKRLYPAEKLTERERLRRRLEFLLDCDFPYDQDEIEVLRQILAHRPRSVGCGGILDPTGRALPSRAPCGICGSCEPGECHRLDISLHR